MDKAWLNDLEIDRSPKIEVDHVLKNTDNDVVRYYETVSKLGVNLDYFFHNEKTLKIYPMFVNDKKVVKAAYHLINNQIITPIGDYSEEITHELTHMATTYFDKEKNKVYSGFHQVDLNKNMQVGVGLNEGYTALFDLRNFADYTGNNGKYKNTVYPIIRPVADYMEMIISRSDMEKAFFNADLKYIKDFLSLLMGEELALSFLYSLDALYHAMENGRKRLIIAKFIYEEIQLFCAEAYYTKITDMYRAGTLSQSDYKYFLDVPKMILMDRIKLFGKINLTKDMFNAFPYIEERYNNKYLDREKNNCLIK